MSVTFNVSYNNIGKKLSIARTLTIGDLVHLSCEKFGIPSGELYYNNKKLDSSLPIRFSSLINNCKLVLKDKPLEAKVIGVKLYFPGGSAIKKLSNTIELSAIIDELLLPVDNLAMGYMGKTIAVKDNLSRRLCDIVGDADSLVLRFNVVKDTEEEQRRIAEQQVQEQKLRDQKKREREEKEKEKEQEAENEKRQREVEDKQEHNAEMDVDSKPNSTGNSSIRTESPATVTQVENSIVLDPVVQNDTLESRSLDSTYANNNRKLSHEVDRKLLNSITIKEENKPQDDIIYEPSNTKYYENPDEDYEFTVNHAKLYQNIIKYKPPKKSSPVEKLEGIYKIRIKFPNNYILEIQIHNTQKFGELIKKIDNHLTEDFKSNYNLKLSYPPFKKFEISFALNGQKLIDIEEFSNQLLLIFESKIPVTGNEYLANQEKFKKFNEMPEVQLEENRQNLPDLDTSTISKAKSPPQSTSSSGSSSSGSKDGKKTPKWLKLGK